MREDRQMSVLIRGFVHDRKVAKTAGTLIQSKDFIKRYVRVSLRLTSV